MPQTIPVRLGPAETTLIDQLNSVGASATAERISVAGLPTRRVEAYHYTDLKMLLRTVPGLAGEQKALGDSPFRIDGAHRIPMTNGVADIDGVSMPGVRLSVEDSSSLSQRDDIIVRLNEAFARKTLRVSLDQSVGAVIHIDRRTEGAAAHMSDSVHLFAAAGVEATVIETFAGSDEAHLANHATFVSVGEGAKLTHIVVDLSPAASTHFDTSEYQIAADAQLRTLVIHAGAGLARSQVFAKFEGEGAHADFTGLNLVNDGQHCDITLDVNHAVPNTTSKELYKQIARGRSKAVFQGRIVVSRDAQKTDGKMMMQGLMLSDEAEILSKPELEIYADDVVCGHGSTCGKLDEDHLFYLMSRGIPEAPARALLVKAFVGEVVEEVEHEAAVSALEERIDAWLHADR